MSMCGNALPIGHNPVLMIGADRCVEGAFGDWDMVHVALDWKIGFELADKFGICIGMADWLSIGIGNGLAINRTGMAMD